MKFTVLMTVYHGEKTEYFDRALHSILVEQTELPEQFVLVYDGPVHNGIQKTVEKYKVLYQGQFDVIELPENMGQGAASKAGMEYCRNELVARMDSDDISVNTRFENQLEIFRNNPDIDIVGGWIAEFNDSKEDDFSIRLTPETHEEILKMFQKRNPVNNVTVMFRKNSLVTAGGYSVERGNEDFRIYCKMLIAGARFYNIQKPLVHVRVGQEMILRRGNMELYRGWKKNQKLLFDGGVISRFRYFRNCFSCYLFIKSPCLCKKIAYQFVLRRKSHAKH